MKSFEIFKKKKLQSMKSFGIFNNLFIFNMECWKLINYSTDMSLKVP